MATQLVTIMKSLFRGKSADSEEFDNALFGYQLIVSLAGRVFNWGIKGTTFYLISLRAVIEIAFPWALHKFPATYFRLTNYVNSRLPDGYTEYVCCEDCYACYHPVKFQADPNLTGKKSRANENSKRDNARCKCGCVLFEKHMLKKGHWWKPKKRYFYQSVIDRLSQMMKRGPEFVEMLDHWRHIDPDPSDYLRDFYDGKLWAEWTRDDGVLVELGGIAFILNYDGFNPFGNCVDYSMGTIYLSIANLPREERYRRENVIIVGIITGPKHPTGNMNTFLRPLVDELKVLFKGKDFTLKDGSTMRVRGALFAIVCDCPAARQLTQFISHAGICGCHRCFKQRNAADEDGGANWARDGKTYKLKTGLFVLLAFA